mmetsp:Transcript_20086/g.36693  ORF Transcript_20086/g.36693 Transcript_20086/m.36693 type:complete len:501 (-) Transcript_20086:12-1514(-)
MGAFQTAFAGQEGAEPPVPTEAAEEAAEPDLAEDNGVPDEPPGIDMDEVMDAAKTDALEDDWACMKEHAWGNDKMPGLRYGASIEMRPLTVVLPCPCAGGVWNPPREDDGARLDWTGLWHEPSEGHGTIAGLPHPTLNMMAKPPDMEMHHREDLMEDYQADLEKLQGQPRPDLEHQVSGTPTRGHLVVRDHEDRTDIDDERGVQDHPVESANQAIGQEMKELQSKPRAIETSELEISQSSQRDGSTVHNTNRDTSGISRPSSRHHDILVAAAAKKRKLTTKTPGIVKQFASVSDTDHARRRSHQHHQFPHHRRKPSSRNVVASVNVAPEGHPPKMSSFMISGEAFEKYYPGSEPYAIDFGCAKGNMRDMMTRKWKPGMRWKDVPGWTAIVVPTPCPCALGVFTRVQTPPVNHLPPTPDSLFVDPDLGGLTNANPAPWQGPNSTKLGSMAFAAVMMALLSARAGTSATPGCARWGLPTDAASPVRRPVLTIRAAQDFSSFL